MAATVKKRRLYEKLHCPHCEESVSKSTWYIHYSQFFNPSTGQWEKKVKCEKPGFNFGDTERSSGSDSGSEALFLTMDALSVLFSARQQIQALRLFYWTWRPYHVPFLARYQIQGLRLSFYIYSHGCFVLFFSQQGIRFRL